MDPTTPSTETPMRLRTAAPALTVLLALPAVRVNITVGPDGIEHEGMFGTRRVRWGDIAALETIPKRTGPLTGLTV